MRLPFQDKLSGRSRHAFLNRGTTLTSQTLNAEGTGPPKHDKDFRTPWPNYDEEEIEAVNKVLRSEGELLDWTGHGLNPSLRGARPDMPSQSRMARLHWTSACTD